MPKKEKRFRLCGPIIGSNLNVRKDVIKPIIQAGSEFGSGSRSGRTKGKESKGGKGSGFAYWLGSLAGRLVGHVAGVSGVLMVGAMFITAMVLVVSLLVFCLVVASPFLLWSGVSSMAQKKGQGQGQGGGIWG